MPILEICIAEEITKSLRIPTAESGLKECLMDRAAHRRARRISRSPTEIQSAADDFQRMFPASRMPAGECNVARIIADAYLLPSAAY